jgi:hypothetical protein
MNHFPPAPKLTTTCLAVSLALVLGVPDAYLGSAAREAGEDFDRAPVTNNAG